MDAETFLGGRVSLYPGDCRDVLRTLPDASVDSVVTDPPYALVSIAKRYGRADSVATKAGVYARSSGGFMGKTWDTGETAFAVEFWAEVLRVLKPGGHVVAFSGTRTYHRMACAIEDAGFEIRDMIAWVYGSGFPKSHDVSKAIDKAAGAERTERLAPKPGHENFIGRDNTKSLRESGALSGDGGFSRPWMSDPEKVENAHWQFAPATDAARQWSGWGTALKPALEPITVARKPMVGTVAANVLEHGTGALNIDGCRVAGEVENRGGWANAGYVRPRTAGTFSEGSPVSTGLRESSGRWPANLIHDGSDEVVAAFPSARSAGDYPSRSTARDGVTSFSGEQGQLYADAGSAARFFYSAKADADDRLGSKHPTVKPVDLMQYLVRLVTPPGGLVLDPFAGTGTTGEAAWREGMCAVLVERESAYQDDIRRRMALCLAGPDERRRATIKARGADEKMEPLPLFGGAE